MPILIVVAIAVLVILLLGPVGGGILALLAAVGAAGMAGVIILIAGIAFMCTVGAVILASIGWCIWWLIDPQGAGDSLEAYETVRKLRR